LGALPIDIDARAGTELFAKFISLTRPTYMACTPSLAEYLIRKTPELLGHEVGDFHYKGVFTTGEVGIAIPEIKKKLESAYGCRFYDYWAPCGNAPAISCDSDEYYGMHAIAPDVCTSYEDLVDPLTKRPVDADVDGAVGEMVQTNLQREACPVVKYAYGDIVQLFLKECPGCGFKGRRIKVIGRADDMLIIKGVNVYPMQVEQVLMAFAEVGNNYVILLDRDGPFDRMTVRIEVNSGLLFQGPEGLEALRGRIARALREEILLTPRVEFAEAGTLPAGEGKAVRVIDNRPKE